MRPLLLATALLALLPATASALCSPQTGTYDELVRGTYGTVGYWRLGETARPVACASVGLAGRYTKSARLGAPGALAADADRSVSVVGRSAAAVLPGFGAAKSSATIGAWIRPTATHKAGAAIISDGRGWVLALDRRRRLVLTSTDAPAYPIARSGVRLRLRRWQHVAATLVDRKPRLYVNGRNVTRQVKATARFGGSLRVGAARGLGPFTGRIDEVALYERALSAREIAFQTSVGRNPPTGASSEIAATGDIACSSNDARYNDGAGQPDGCQQRATSDLVSDPALSAILGLGDLQYDNGSLRQYQTVFDATWGRFRDRIRPVPGNHEYRTDGAAGYFDYFNGPGVLDGPAGNRSLGYYSFDIGTWRAVALNSNCAAVGGCGPGSPQLRWLVEELAANRATCTLAFMHHPVFDVAKRGNEPVGDLFKALYDGGVDLLLTAHTKVYQRFAPQAPGGQLDPARGIREFVVGTGGESREKGSPAGENTEALDVADFGVLRLRLSPVAYAWDFEALAPGKYSDGGIQACNKG